jgi:hypothetical protein
VNPLRAPIKLKAQIQDILSLVVGYALAALLFRAFWPARTPSAALGVPGVGFYLWLGLAMSGPIVLLREGPRRRAAPDSTDTTKATSRTWAELAWLLIGMYWILLGLFLIPLRLRAFKLGDALLFGLVPIVVALGLRLVGPNASQGPDGRMPWTHGAAVSLLATWPIAWICLILLGELLG